MNSESSKLRFSDEKLREFHNEFKEHKRKYEERQKQSEVCVQELIKAQQKNTDAIATLIEETRDIVQLHRDLQGATRIGMSAQKFGVWLLKWGAIGSGLAAMYHFGIDWLKAAFP